MLQTWDVATGTPMVSIGDLLYKFCGQATVGWTTTGAAQSGVITDPRFSQYPGCEVFAFVSDGSFDLRGGGLKVEARSDGVYWSYPYPDAVQWKRVPTTFIYGIY